MPRSAEKELVGKEGKGAEGKENNNKQTGNGKLVLWLSPAFGQWVGRRALRVPELGNCTAALHTNTNTSYTHVEKLLSLLSALLRAVRRAQPCS